MMAGLSGCSSGDCTTAERAGRVVDILLQGAYALADRLMRGGEPGVSGEDHEKIDTMRLCSAAGGVCPDEHRRQRCGAEAQQENVEGNLAGYQLTFRWP